jgi:drug/metabolite transporter (DMT)-like permease
VTFLFTALALTAFAANSLLCRLALGGGLIDAASFTTIRMVAGAAMLGAIATTRQPGDPKRVALRTKERSRLPASSKPSWTSAVALFVYAITFSLAYVSLPVATGALVLFGAVQTTMLGAAIRGGERPHPIEWAGFLVAVAGLLYLVSPGLTAPSLWGAAMMIASGVSWGWYSLLGRRSASPLDDTTINFIRTVPLTVLVSLMAVALVDVTPAGALAAAVSGSVTSGLGYVAWYAALTRLSATRAATVQLATPVVTAAGGVLFLGEQVSPRLGISAALILGGIAVATLARPRR